LVEINDRISRIAFINSSQRAQATSIVSPPAVIRSMQALHASASSWLQPVHEIASSITAPAAMAFISLFLLHHQIADETVRLRKFRS
jgi:hypothetical protein